MSYIYLYILKHKKLSSLKLRLTVIGAPESKARLEASSTLCLKTS